MLTTEEIIAIQDALGEKGYSQPPGVTVTLNGREYDLLDVDKVSAPGVDEDDYTGFVEAGVWKVILSTEKVIFVDPGQLDENTYELLLDVAFPT